MSSIQEKVDQLDDEYRWKDETNISELVPLEAALRCDICCCFMTAPVILLPCFTSFCSSCIRAALNKKFKDTRKATCPHCGVEVNRVNDYKNSIFPNARLEEVIQSFKRARGPLLEELSSSRNSNSHSSSGGTNDGPSLAISASAEEPAKTRRSTRRSSSSSSASASSTLEPPSNPQPLKPPPRQQRRKRRTKPFYTGKNKKQLVQLCKDDHLDTNGTEEDLKLRHQHFIELYNSECDSAHPRSTAVLRRIVSEKERERRASRKTAKAQKNILENLQTTGSTGNTELDATVNSKWAEMANGLKKQHQAAKESKTKTDSTKSADKDDEEPSSTTTKSTDESEQSGETASNYSDTNAASSASSTTLSNVQAPIQNSIQNNPDTNTSRSTQLTQPTTKGDDNDETTIPHSSTKRKSPDSSPRSDDPAQSEEDDVVVLEPPLLRTVHTNQSPNKKKKLSSNNSPSSSLIGPWVCQVCTFRNEKRKGSRSKCEICEQPRLVAH